MTNPSIPGRLKRTIQFLKSLIRPGDGAYGDSGSLDEPEITAQYLRAFDLCPDWMTLSTLDEGRYLSVNEAFVRATGYKREEAVGATSLGLGIWSDPGDRKAFVAEVLAKGSVANAEFRCRTRAGKELLLLRSSRLVRYQGRQCLFSVNRDISDRRSLEQSLAKLSLAVEQSLVSVVITDKNGAIEYVNPNFERLTGYRSDELLGRNPRVLKSGRHPAGFYREMWDTLAAGREFRGELLNKKKNGELFWENASISPLRDGKGEITHYIGIKEDITERKRLEHALAASESYLRNLLDNAADAVLVIGTSSGGRILDANKAACASLGYAREELLRLSLPDIVAEYEPQRRETIFAELFRTRSMTIETRHRGKDGAPFPVEVRLGLLEKDGEKMIVAIARDITERKNAEAALRESEARFRSYVENAPTAVFVTDSRGRYRDFNPAALKLLAYESSVLRGMSIGDIVPGEDRAAWAHDFQSLVMTGRFEGERRLQAADHRVFWASLRAVRVTDDRYLAFCRDITERRHAGDKIKQLLNEQQTILNAAPMGIVFVKDRRVQWANPAFDRMFGYERDETRGMATLAFYADPGAYAELGAAGYAAIRSGGIYRSEEEMARKDGFRFSCSISGCAVNTESDADGSIWILEDITDRKKAEAALQKSRLDLLAILNNLPFHAWLKDAEGRFLAVNQPFAQLVGGSSPDDIVGKTDYDLWPADLAQAYRADDREVIRTRKQKPIEEQVPGKTGLRWFETYKSPLLDMQGTVTGTTGFSRDITDRKRSEENLLKRINFESAIAAISGDFAGKTGSRMDDGINKALRIIGRTVKADRSYLITISGGVMDNTHEWCEDGIRSERESLRRIPLDRFPWIMGRLTRLETVTLASMQDLPAEAVSERREFLRESIKSLIAVPVASGGRLHGFIGFEAVSREHAWSADDIRLIQLVAGIFSRVIERRRAEEEILRARDAAEVASRAKTLFLANISHEIRTPMNAILGLTDLVLDSELAESQRRNLEVVRQSGQNLLSLLNQLLDLSKIEAGKMELHETDFNLAAVLDDALVPFRLQARQKGLSLYYEIDDTVPGDLRGDVGFLRQIITNLIGNSLKFTEQGEIALSVRADGMTPGRERHILLFSVKDTGTGIPAEKTESIFDIFTQADGSITRKYGGTGLGLAISKRLVGYLGGRIWVSSVHGKGSIFNFTACLAKAGPAPVAAVPGRQGARVTSGRRYGALQVLLAEDNAANQELVRQVLSKRGHAVSVAADGREAVRLARQNDFAVILMDIQMPEMDGLEALRILRSDPDFTRRGIPVIALTAHAFESDREQFLKAGFDGYLSKPFTVPELTRIVEDLASRPSPAAGEKQARRDAAAADAPALNIEEALARLDGDRDILTKILRLYLQDTPVLLESLERSVENRTARDMERYAHSIKAVSANIGAYRAVNAAQRIEASARGKSLEQVPGIMKELKRELERVFLSIPHYLEHKT